MTTNHSARNRMKVLLCALVVVMGLGACGTKAAPANSTGPSTWTATEKSYLSQIASSGLAASNFYSEENYVQTGHVVCDSLKAGKTATEVLQVLVTAARANGLAVNDRQAFATTVSAGAVAYLCPEELAQLTK